jgi:N,N'-diacetyllegionaminate synthase
VNVGIVILCRYDSKRLPGKILHEIHGRSVLSYIVERIQRAAPLRPLVVATSTDVSDDRIASYCRRAGLKCFRGSLDDVAGRFLACADSHGWDFAVRINGDNLFLDSDTLLAMLAIADTDAYDLVTNLPGRSFPFGMSVEIVRTSFYRSVMKEFSDAIHREHVTSWLYDNSTVGRRYVYMNNACPEAAGLQLSLDTPQDLEKATRILERAGTTPACLGLQQVYTLATTEVTPSPWRGAAGPLLIAEIGGNHEGDFEVALAMTQSAIESGVDCVKFQIYSGDTLVSPVESPDRHKHFQKFELKHKQHVALAQMCRAAGVNYLASVWDLDILQWIDPYMDFYKIGSGDLSAWPLLRDFARRGKPILLSTGLATMDEVLQTVRQIQAVDARYCKPEMFCILQCTSMYPIPDSDANLRVMESLRAASGLSVGYSDHTTGISALLAAAAMGAEVLEFHFTLSREGKTFRDHQVSLVAEEVRQLKHDIAQITALRGSFIKVPQPSELKNHHEISFRRGVYIKRPLKVGEIISDDDIVLLRPAHGTDARDADLVAGARVLRDIAPFQALHHNLDYA